MTAAMSLDDRIIHLAETAGVTRCGAILQRPIIFGNVLDVAHKSDGMCPDCFDWVESQ